MYEILQHGGIAPGGFNFDAKLRRQSSDRTDRDRRYAGWDTELGKAILDGSVDLPGLEARVADGRIDPRRASGAQERLENIVNQSIWAADR